MGVASIARETRHFVRIGVSRRTTRQGLDAILLVSSLLLATCFRYDFGFFTNSSGRLVVVLASAVALLLAAGRATGLYSGRWRPGGLEEAYALGVASAITAVGAFMIDVTLGHPLPASATLAAGPIALVAMAGARLYGRVRGAVGTVPPKVTDVSSAPTKLVIFGAGDGANDVLGAMRRDGWRTYQPLALLDDDPAKSNLRLHGVPVRGTREDLPRVARATGAKTLLIAVPSAEGIVIRDLTERATQAGLDILVLPPVSELFNRMPGVADIRPMRMCDLLGRREVDLDLESASSYLQGRRVLITGAGGSIGSELCRQVLRLDPAAMFMLDRDESALHALQLSLHGRAMLDDPQVLVADIRDRDRVFRVMAECRPDVVFHAAALKHLPLLEMYPEEALKTNVLGSLNVLEAAAAAGVGRYVNVSTDKAADPISVLGYSKRITERLTAWQDAHQPGNYLSVRFGNVLGSRGSVLTAFQAQVAARSRVTVTHPDATRYFMTVEEAVGLVIQAGAVGGSGDVLVLDMGEPVRIRDVAQEMIRQSGQDLSIIYTGLRPGEKIHEVLFARGEPDVRPAHAQISHVPVTGMAPDEVRAAAALYQRHAVTAWMCATATGGEAFAPVVGAPNPRRALEDGPV